MVADPQKQDADDSHDEYHEGGNADVKGKTFLFACHGKPSLYNARNWKSDVRQPGFEVLVGFQDGRRRFPCLFPLCGGFIKPASLWMVDDCGNGWRWPFLWSAPRTVIEAIRRARGGVGGKRYRQGRGREDVLSMTFGTYTGPSCNPHTVGPTFKEAATLLLASSFTPAIQKVGDGVKHSPVVAGSPIQIRVASSFFFLVLMAYHAILPFSLPILVVAHSVRTNITL